MGSATVGEWSALRYNFLGVSGPDAALSWLQDHYHRRPVEEIQELYARLYTQILKPWYGQPRWEALKLYEDNTPFSLFPHLCEHAQRDFGFSPTAERIECEELGITFANPFRFLLTEYAARSFRVNGFKDIVLIGDSGPNQKGLQSAAARLNKEWADSGVRVHYIGDYYHSPAFNKWLRSQGETAESIGTHAGIEDTSELMAINPDYIRKDKLAPGGDFKVTGVSGNPARASVAYGKQGLEFKIAAAVAQIRKVVGGR